MLDQLELQLAGLEETAAQAETAAQWPQLTRLRSPPSSAGQAVKRIDVLFATEREINGLVAQERRLRVRQDRSRAFITKLQTGYVST